MTPPAAGVVSPARRLAAPLLTLVTVALLLPSPARGSGFSLPAPSAEALGLAGAVTAGTREPAAVWLNPAALAFAREERAISLGGTLLEFRTRFVPVVGAAASSRPGLQAVPALFGHSRVTSWLTLGLGLHAPWGLVTRWPDEWQGARQALESRIQATATTVVLAVRLHERLSLGAGTSFVHGRFTFRSALPAEAQGRVKVWGNGWGTTRTGSGTSALSAVGALAGHLALEYRVLPEVLELAVVYHARTPLTMSGHADFDAANGAYADIYVDQRVSTMMVLPDILVVAAAFRPRPGLTLSAEVERARWSSLPRLALDFERQGTADIVIERDSGDPLSVRTGGELWLPRRPIALRVGASFEGNATPAENLEPGAPDANRLGVALGAGYLMGRFKLDVGYLYSHFLSATARPRGSGPEAAPGGTYRSRLHAFSLTLTVR